MENNIPQHSVCRKCGKTIFWHKSAKTGKSYPTDLPSDRRAFHKCIASPAEVEKPPLAPNYFEPTLDQRVDALEKQVSQLSQTLREVQSRQPITGSDVGF